MFHLIQALNRNLCLKNEAFLSDTLVCCPFIFPSLHLPIGTGEVLIRVKASGSATANLFPRQDYSSNVRFARQKGIPGLTIGGAHFFQTLSFSRLRSRNRGQRGERHRRPPHAAEAPADFDGGPGLMSFENATRPHTRAVDILR